MIKERSRIKENQDSQRQSKKKASSIPLSRTPSQQRHGKEVAQESTLVIDIWKRIQEEMVKMSQDGAGQISI